MMFIIVLVNVAEINETKFVCKFDEYLPPTTTNDTVSQRNTFSYTNNFMELR